MFHPARLTTALIVTVMGFSMHAGGGAAIAQEDDAVDLRPLWRDGQVARYRLTQTQTTQAEMAGVDNAEPQQSVQEFRGEMTWRVLEANENGGGTAEMTIDSLEMTVTGPGGESRSASASRGDEGMEPVQQWLSSMVGTPLTFVVGSDGEIGSVSGYETIQRQAGPEMGESMNERYFRNLGRDMAALVGGQADARVGTNWTSSSASSHQFGEVAAEARYEVVGVERPAGVPTVTIERSATLELTPELPDLPADGPEVDFQQLDGQSSGFVMFDLSRHEIVGYFSQQTLAAEVSFILPDRRMTQTMTETTDTQMLRISEE